MPDARQRAELATRVEQRRQELGARADVSQRLRELSASGSHFPAPPSRGARRSTLNTVVITTIAGLALLLIVAVAVTLIAGGLWVQSQLNSPTTTVENFYSAVHQQDYATAYSKLSSQAQSSLSESKFEQMMRATDLISGGVQSYAIVSSTTSGSTATVMVDLVRSGDSSTALVYRVTLTQEQRSWLVSTIRQTGQTKAPTPSN